MPVAAVAEQVLASDEFQSRFGGLPDDKFVWMIADHLRIHTDTIGYVDRLSRGESRGDVVATMIDHPDAVWSCDGCGHSAPLQGPAEAWPSPPRAAQIWRLYQAYFLRAADHSGLNYWLDLYWGGTSLTAISDYMAASPEFVRRYGSLSDGQFVDRVYANVLGRAAEPGGRAYWVEQLGAGLSRGDMMIGFSDSPEFIRRTDTIPPGG